MPVDCSSCNTVGSAAAQPPPHFIEREVCPGCGQGELQTLHRQRYLEGELWGFLRSHYHDGISPEWLAGAEYRLEECRACSLVFQRSAPTGRFLEVLYDEWLNAEHHPDADPIDREAMARPLASRDGHELLSVSLALRKPLSELRVLDYGMGWGLWPRVALRLGARDVFGFDLSNQRVEYGRQQGIQIVHRSGLAGLGLDFINADQVFEHLGTPREDAALLAAALRPGGILKLAVPRAPGLHRRLRKLDWDAPRKGRKSLNAVHPLEHLNCWSRRSLDTLGWSVGLEPVVPSLRATLAFLAQPRSVRWESPRHLVKSLLRGPYNRWSQTNLYAWYRRP